MSLSVVIPAYNEELRIRQTIKEIISYLERERMSYEIIVVDDGSRDNTAKVVESMDNGHVKLLRNGRNRGKGFTVKNGVLHARMQYILFSDADLSTPIKELPKLLAYIDRFDIVIGSRRMKQSHIVIQQPWHRRVPGKVFPFIVNLFILRGIRDTQCGFKLFRKSVARSLFKMQTLERFSFDAEILFLAQRLGFSVKEVPITWINALDSKLNAVTDSFSMFLELLKVRWNFIAGKYKLDGKSVKSNP